MHFDIAIIGGGPGGYVAAIYGAKKNKKIALIEKSQIGGTCLNRGCIPTKSLIHCANLYNDMKNSSNFGIKADNIDVDWEKIQKNKEKIVTTLNKGVLDLLKVNGVKVYEGTAKVKKNNAICIRGKNEEEITADNIILAAGSEAVNIPIPGADLEGVIYSDKVLALKKIPKSLLILGGGVIGLEMAYIYNTFGVEVTIIEMLPEIIFKHDNDIIKELEISLKKQGIRIYTSSKVKQIEKDSDKLLVHFETKEGLKELQVDNVLISAGRKASVEQFKELKLKTTKIGIEVDDYLKTNKNNIYAIGDITGKSMLAHVASHQGITAIKNILGRRCKMDYDVIPSCIYTHPEAASVGITEQQAFEKYNGNIKVGKFPFSACGKSLTIGNKDGFVKVIAEGEYNEVVGVHIVGPNATELIGEATLAMKLECTAEELTDTIHSHPTLTETIMEANYKLLNIPIHTV